MLIVLIRHTYNERETRGSLAIDGVPYCQTLEPPVKGNATHPKGSIPMGWYKIQVSYSPKFKRVMPLLELVPGFSGIRIHAGLKVENTQGCICVGVRANEDRLTKMLIKAQENGEEIFICVTDSEHADSQLQNIPGKFRKPVGSKD